MGGFDSLPGVSHGEHRRPAAQKVRENEFTARKSVVRLGTETAEDFGKLAVQVRVKQTSVNVILAANRGCISQCVGHSGDYRLDYFLASRNFLDPALIVKRISRKRGSLPCPEIFGRKLLAASLAEVVIDGEGVGRVNCACLIQELEHTGAGKALQLFEEAHQPLISNGNLPPNTRFASKAQDSAATLDSYM